MTYFYNAKVGISEAPRTNALQMGRVWSGRHGTALRPPRHAPACMRSAPRALGTEPPPPSCCGALLPSHGPLQVKKVQQQSSAQAQRVAKATPRDLVLLGVHDRVE